MLSSDVETLKVSEDRLTEITAGYEEALDSLPEEEKEKEFVNDDKTAFVWPEVKKAIKAKELDADIISVLKKGYSDNEEEKKLKKQIKDGSAALHMATKTTIERLSDNEVIFLLHEKWIVPLVYELCKLPESIIDDFVSKLEKLTDKYSTTFSEVENQIIETEKELSGMLDMLTGDEYDMLGLAELKKMLGGM